MKRRQALASLLGAAGGLVLPRAGLGAEQGPAGVFPAEATFRALADQYFDRCLWPANPSAATSYGIHRYDHRLEDYSRAGVRRHVRSLRRYLSRFEALSPDALPLVSRHDRLMLMASIRSQLLTLEELRTLERDPDACTAGITASAYAIMQRDFAPAAERLRALVSRQRAMPGALRAAREQLENPPRLWTEIALEQLPGVIAFFRDDLPLAFREVDDAALKRRFEASNAAVIRALEEHGAWLREDLLPRSAGDYRLGADLFRRKLALDEFVDTPLEELLALGMEDLRRNQEEFARVASRLEPGRSRAEVLELLGRDYPAPSRVLDTVRETFDGLVRFIRERDLMTLPEAPPPIVRETPPFMRATTFASIDPPPPFEPRVMESYFNVTLPEPTWDEARVAGFMSQLSYPVLSTVSVHEAYPGHYVQLLFNRTFDNRVRKVLGAMTNIEGWAHYVEQMMLDEGYGRQGRNAREADLLRLGQLQDALLRNARYVVAIRLHTQDMTFEEAVRFFVEEGYQSPAVGETEARRGTSDPMYLSYTLGKLQILKLREEVRAREGAAFSLRSFHDRLLRAGQSPIALLRDEILAETT